MRLVIGPLVAQAACLCVGLAQGFGSLAFTAAEGVGVVGMLALDRVLSPVLDRWRRGAEGEERVGEIIDGLRGAGWRALHDVDTGRGNIDHVLVGPGGILTVETKSHRGRLAVDRLDARMLRQAYAQAKHVERLTGQRATPLLVFSRAYLDHPVAVRRGVTVLPARMLAARIIRRRRELGDGEVAELYHRLAATVA